MKLKKNELAEASAAIEAKRAEVKAAWGPVQDAKAKAKAAGAAALAEGSTEFAELDAAGVVYDGLVDELKTMEGNFGRLSDMMSDDGPVDNQSAHQALAGLQAMRAQADPIGLDVDGFMADYHEWAQQMGAALTGKSRFGNSPTFKVLSKENFINAVRGDFRNATVTMPDFPSLPTRRPGVVPLPTANLSLLDVIPMIPVTTDTVEFVYEKTYTNNAVETAEAGEAGEGVSEWDKSSVTCVWIPFTIPATKQILTDEPRMQAFLQNRLLYGVKARLQNQLINGDGQGENLRGITHWPSILTHRSGGDSDYPFDVIHKGMTAIRIATYGMYEPQTLLVHPNDLELLTLAKDGMDRFYFGGPQSDMTKPIWGMTPISHPSITQGSPIVCDINACECYVREDVNLSVTDSHADNFTHGLIQFLAQGRFAFAILEHRAFAEIQDFDS